MEKTRKGGLFYQGQSKRKVVCYMVKRVSLSQFKSQMRSAENKLKRDLRRTEQQVNRELNRLERQIKRGF